MISEGKAMERRPSFQPGDLVRFDPSTYHCGYSYRAYAKEGKVFRVSRIVIGDSPKGPMSYLTEVLPDGREGSLRPSAFLWRLIPAPRNNEEDSRWSSR